MPRIILETLINAPIERCFDLSRSIDLHKISTEHTKEEAIAGQTKGLIALGQYVTWEAYHFGIKQQLSTKITAFERPYHFTDEQIKGIFKFMKHQHNFREEKNGTLMTDTFIYKAPLGIFGMITEKIMLTSYLKNLLVKRNCIIKDFAESKKYKLVLL